ncbi:MAG: prepilin-type N-terminal cleavage/methylation domain-containing protein [Planctomycetaceae bacterium]|nr:prepilin-type N-terminal cleavage/methylation domain-containing protein [Planctomycetaceae bacterium]
MITQQQHVARRQGFTLVELLIAVTLLTTMAVFGFHVISLMLSIQRSNMESGTSAVSMSRLTERFRNDVHNADAVRFVKPKLQADGAFESLEIDFGRTTITYQSVEGGLERVVPSQNPNRPVERDIFRLPNLATEFVDEQPIVGLLLHAEASFEATSRKEDLVRRIDAVIGRGGVK